MVPSALPAEPDPDARPGPNSRFHNRGLIGGIVAISLFVHVFCLVADRTFLKRWLWQSLPVHAALETSGALIAFLVAGVLLRLDRRGQGTSFNLRIASALICMGVLDGMHALVHAGQEFVWLHTAASVGGGLLFALVWMPAEPTEGPSRRWPAWALAVSFLVGLGSLFWPQAVPPMLAEGVFTPLARNLNLAGGILLFVAAAGLMRAYLRGGNTDDLLFCMHCFLFGAAAVMFEQSVLWDAPWWGWHFLRLMAYVVAFAFIVSTLQRADEEARSVQKELLALREREKDLVAEELAKVQDQVVRKTRLATIGQIAASIAHELRNPLSTVRNATYYLKRRVRSENPKYLEYLAIIDQEVSSADRVIHDMMEMARSKEPAKESVDLRRALTQVMDQLKPTADLRLEVSLDREPFLVTVDQGQMCQVLSNILHNAIQVMGAQGRIQVTARREAGFDVITIADDGPGVDPLDRDQIFEPLFTTKAKGTGLGLAICRQIIQRHGGTIELESSQGGGAAFCLRIPIA